VPLFFGRAVHEHPPLYHPSVFSTRQDIQQSGLTLGRVELKVRVRVGVGVKVRVGVMVRDWVRVRDWDRDWVSYVKPKVRYVNLDL
jgi:hypothetical protein